LVTIFFARSAYCSVLRVSEKLRPAGDIAASITWLGVGMATVSIREHHLVRGRYGHSKYTRASPG